MQRPCHFNIRQDIARGKAQSIRGISPLHLGKHYGALGLNVNLLAVAEKQKFKWHENISCSKAWQKESRKILFQETGDLVDMIEDE
ncbi:hypothetical protein PoB_005495300 [Plakobranchus ocellatus]|uniref:Uncharacterized protein n=1 Tax=Plakobranchus ocellatus TaxID=259542 RepID=A0AAV4C978_9GAST|nr:hypothetical protein PoB_005495300 [Plakobranchus ocellatus]